MSEKPIPQPARGLSTPYVMIWALPATLSLIYLTILVVDPSLIAAYFGSSPEVSSPQSNEGQRAATDAVAEIRTLRESVSQVQGEVEALKAEMSSQTERARALTTRLAALETDGETPDRAADASDAPGRKGKDAAGPPVKLAGKVPSDRRSDEQKLTPPPGVMLLTKEQRPPAAVPPVKASAKADKATETGGAGPALETGSVRADAPAAPVKFGPATVTPAGGNKPIGLHIATGPSIDSLRLNWTLLADRHDGLGALEPRYTTSTDETGVSYDLVVGPVSSAAEAKRMCKELGDKGTMCKVGNFAGEAL